MIALDVREVREAARAVSADGRYCFTKRNLYYELVRRGALAPPSGSPRARLVAFRRALAALEDAHGALERLVRLADIGRLAVDRSLVDLFDYSARRVVVFDRPEVAVMFARNGFHTKIEVVPVAIPAFPPHVFERLVGQLASGFRTVFYVVHDATSRGTRTRARLLETLGRRGRPLVVDLGLTFAQCHPIGLPVRNAKVLPEASGAPLDDALEERRARAAGAYAHFEELPPLAMLRWVYERVAKGAEDVGFG